MGMMLAFGNFVRLGIEKILLVPFLLQMLGEDAVGKFVLLLGWAQVMGQFPAGGAADGVMRLHAEAKEKGSWPALLVTGAGLTGVVSLACLIAAMGIYLLTSEGAFDKSVMLIAIGVGIYTILLAARLVLNIAFRVDLQFGKIAFIESLCGVLLLVAIPIAYLTGIEGVGFGFALAAAITLVFQIFLIRNKLKGQILFNSTWAKRLLIVAPIFALASFMGLAFHQSGRLVLGAFRPYSYVTIFFAAEAAVSLVLTPLNYLASTIYTLVVRKSKIGDISRTAILQHAFSCILCAILVFFLIQLLGYWILKFRYQSVAEKAWPLVQILAFGAAFKATYFLSRGFVYRFCSFKRILSYSVLNTLVLVVLLLAMVPKWGVLGAAWSVSLASSFVGILWFATYLYYFLIKRPENPKDDSENN